MCVHMSFSACAGVGVWVCVRMSMSACAGAGVCVCVQVCVRMSMSACAGVCVRIFGEYVCVVFTFWQATVQS